MPSRRAIAAPDMPALSSSATCLRVTISRLVDILDLRIGGSSNGKTPASGAGYRGSSPCPPVIRTRPRPSNTCSHRRETEARAQLQRGEVGALVRQRGRVDLGVLGEEA